MLLVTAAGYCWLLGRKLAISCVSRDASVSSVLMASLSCSLCCVSSIVDAPTDHVAMQPARLATFRTLAAYLLQHLQRFIHHDAIIIAQFHLMNFGIEV